MGSVPDLIRCATRWASVLVLPVPAPAMMSNGPLPKVAAARCCSLSESNQESASMPILPNVRALFGMVVTRPGGIAKRIDVLRLQSYSFTAPTTL